MLADVFDIFRKMCLKIYKQDPAKFVSAPRLTWQAALNIEMSLMIEKGRRTGVCNSVYCYANVSIKYMRGFDKNKKLSHNQYWDVNNIYG